MSGGTAVSSGAQPGDWAIAAPAPEAPRIAADWLPADVFTAAPAADAGATSPLDWQATTAATAAALPLPARPPRRRRRRRRVLAMLAALPALAAAAFVAVSLLASASGSADPAPAAAPSLAPAPTGTLEQGAARRALSATRRAHAGDVAAARRAGFRALVRRSLAARRSAPAAVPAPQRAVATPARPRVTTPAPARPVATPRPQVKKPARTPPKTVAPSDPAGRKPPANPYG